MHRAVRPAETATARRARKRSRSHDRSAPNGVSSAGTSRRCTCPYSAPRAGLLLRLAARPAGAAGLHLVDPLHQCLVDTVERLREPVGTLADLVGERDELLEVDVAVLELASKVVHEALDPFGELRRVLQ